MSEQIAVMLPIAGWLISWLILFGTAVVARNWFHRGTRRNPLTKELLRGPAHSLLKQPDDLVAELLAYFAFGPLLPFIAITTYLGQPAGATGRAAWLHLAAAAAALGFFSYKIVSHIKRLRNISLGLEAETAVGQELNWLMRDGFAVFHDVPGDKSFNVDHVLVGPMGVFAVETKGRAKPVRADGEEGHRVKCDGQRLIFPGWTEAEPLEQARRNADWLRKWLSSAVGTSVEVKPVLILPGWFIERTQPSNVPVLASSNLRSYFAKQRGAPIEPQLVRQIVHQLDNRCRDVALKTYKPAP
jgi:Nuclease-related domain